MDETELVDGILSTVEDMREEDGVSRQLRERLDEIEHVLREDIALELRVDRVRSILDEVDGQMTVPNHIRTQLWSLSAALELL